MSGSAGNDTYAVDRSSDTVIETAGAGIDTVLSRASSYTLAANVENLTLNGPSGQTGIGNALGNILKGNATSSTLIGGDGNDILIGGRGATVLTGGAGSDIFQFDSASNNAARVTDFTPGTDMLDLRGLFSNYQGSNPVATGHISFTSDGAGGTRVVFDSDGTGTSRAGTVLSTLQGVSPSSLVMQSDWFFSGSTGSTPPTTPPPAVSSGLFTLPTSGAGIDTVPVVSSSYTAPDGIENLLLSGSSAQNVTGNGLSNIIWSNNYASTINAAAGNDIIVAGKSWDVLTGGAGRDIFQFESLPWNAARVTDFTTGVDMLDLRPIFAAHNYQGTNPAADGYISFQADGAGGTKIYFDADGWGSATPWGYLVATLDNVSPAGLHMQTDWFFH